MLWFQALLRPCPSQKSCGHIGFPTTTKVNFLASPQQRTPWPVFQDGRCNTSPTSSYYNVTTDSFGRFHSLRATSGCHYLVSGSISHPNRGTFQLSLTVLLLYRSWDVFRIRSWCLPHSNPISNGSYSRTIQKLQQNISTGLSPSTVLKFQIEFDLIEEA